MTAEKPISTQKKLSKRLFNLLISGTGTYIAQWTASYLLAFYNTTILWPVYSVVCHENLPDIAFIFVQQFASAKKIDI